MDRRSWTQQVPFSLFRRTTLSDFLFKSLGYWTGPISLKNSKKDTTSTNEQASSAVNDGITILTPKSTRSHGLMNNRTSFSKYIVNQATNGN